MTETWASMCRDVAAFVEVAENKGPARRFRRLASLLEQITPETVAALDKVIDDGDHADRYELHSAILTCRLLATLAATPTEETEDR